MSAVAVTWPGGARARRALRGLGLVLVVAGVLVLLDALVTVLWQEPLSAFYTSIRQGELAGQLAQLEREPRSALTRAALRRLRDEPSRIAYLAGQLEQRAPEGSAVGRILIPRAGASFVMVKGTSTSDLRSGPGVYPQTGFPGMPGTTAIAGHRTTFLAPFRHLDRLRHGDTIEVEMPYAHLRYVVQSSASVAPDAVHVIADAGYQRLVLSACDPAFSAVRRLVVFARLREVQPVGS
jgi:sortase A